MSYPVEGRCPVCEGTVSRDFACHTWTRTRDDGTEQWMACQGCDSATRYYCTAWTEADSEDEWMIEGEDEGYGCGWNWTNGLNPRNPRSSENDKKHPIWWDEDWVT